MMRQHLPPSAKSGPVVFWAAMRRLTRRRGGFTHREVADLAPDASPNTVKCYVGACRRGGFVEVVGDRPAKDSGRSEKLFAVKVTCSSAPFEKDRPARAAVKPGAVQMQLWTAMRAIASWTSQELALAASTDETPVAPAVARKYAAALRRAGYVQEVEPARSRFHGRYRLRPSMNTGPNPPMLREDGSVTDRNRPAGRS